LVNFLILIEKFPKFSKSDIDVGKTPIYVYNLCSIIRESFCLSYSIRKNNNLYLYFESLQLLIKYEGKKLRYLGSDERSQAILLNKALEKINGGEKVKTQGWENSTPGIFVKRLPNYATILENINNILLNKIVFIAEFENKALYPDVINLDDLENMNEYCYILPYTQNSQSSLRFLHVIKENYNLKYINLSNIKGIVNKILYINFRIDQSTDINMEIEK
jgi:putative SAM-dependent RNA methyltransferase